MRDKGIWEAILTALVIIGSCAAMPSGGGLAGKIIIFKQQR